MKFLPTTIVIALTLALGCDASAQSRVERATDFWIELRREIYLYDKLGYPAAPLLMERWQNWGLYLHNCNTGSRCPDPFGPGNYLEEDLDEAFDWLTKGGYHAR